MKKQKTTKAVKAVKSIKAFEMLKNGKSDEDILKICSPSTLRKVKTYYNKKIKNGEDLVLNEYPHGLKSKQINISNDNGSLVGYYTTVKPIDKVFQELNQKSKENEESKNLNISAANVSTLDELIKYSNIDTDKFYCSTFVSNLYGNKANPSIQCKGVFKPKVSGDLSMHEAAGVFNELTKNCLPNIKNNYKKIENNKVSIIPIADLHFGSRSLADETGSDYNLEIARELLIESIKFHIEEAKRHSIKRFIVPVLGDFFNVDTINNTTTKGTPQEETTSWKRTYRKGCELMIDVINMLSQIGNVEVYICNGNHDEMRSFYFSLFLESFYKNSKNVSIDKTNTIRKYILHENHLIGFGHGDTRANTDYLAIMSQESEFFHKAKYRSFFIGHLHHKTTEEKPGITVRRVASLNASNAWHKKKGYQSLRSSDSFIIGGGSGVHNSTFYVD